MLVTIRGACSTRTPQVHMLRSKYKEALSIGQEAVQVFVKTGHKRNQANSTTSENASHAACRCIAA